MDVDDVLFTRKRFESSGVYRADFANSVDPNGPIQSVTAPDARTIVMKLAFPVTTLPAQLANQFGGYPQLLPREADGGFDVRRNPISAGPFYLAEQTPSSNFVVKRHDKFHDPEGRPYVDSIVTTIISEYAAGLAQFKAGHLHKFTVNAEDVLPTKADVPELALYQTPVAANGGGFFFGYRPNDKNPFRDVRVRQAMSLALDRDLYIDVFYNVADFESQGIPVETRWNSAIAASFFEGWWLRRGQEADGRGRLRERCRGHLQLPRDPGEPEGGAGRAGHGRGRRLPVDRKRG
jgi:ABC-type transport system substrate-binding protein